MAVAVAALLLGACASKDAKRGDVVDALTDAGVPQTQAECAADRFDRQFDQGQLNDLAEADDADDVGNDLWDRAQTILQECIRQQGGESSASDESTSTTEEGGETTETTGEETTTTAASE